MTGGKLRPICNCFLWFTLVFVGYLGTQSTVPWSDWKLATAECLPQLLFGLIRLVPSGSLKCQICRQIEEKTFAVAMATINYSEDPNPTL